MKCDIEIAIGKMNKTDKYNAFLRDGNCSGFAGADHEVVEGALRNVKFG